jgi:hypothetical protein
MFCHNGYPETARGEGACDSEARYCRKIPEGIDCRRGTDWDASGSRVERCTREFSARQNLALGQANLSENRACFSGSQRGSPFSAFRDDRVLTHSSTLPFCRSYADSQKVSHHRTTIVLLCYKLLKVKDLDSDAILSVGYERSCFCSGAIYG